MSKGGKRTKKKSDDLAMAERLIGAYAGMRAEIAKVIVGMEEVIEHIFISLLCSGHCLLIGVPGLAKTLMVQTLAKATDLKFSRIQFTPDLMPADITGTDIIEEDPATGKRHFRFVEGPIFSNILLADEINRTPPKTQSALLEAMQEYQVTCGEETYQLKKPFFVLATQNPIEQEGTYPLPEAQLDRFMLNILIDYPSKGEEEEMVKRTTSAYVGEVEVAFKGEEIMDVQSLVRRVPVADHIVELAAGLVRRTRPEDGSPKYIKDWVRWGAGPRGSQYLVLTAKARAILHERLTPNEEDIFYLAYPVLRHRMVTSFAAEAEGVKPDDILERVIGEVKKK